MVEAAEEEPARPSFTWVSKDPRTGSIVPYDERSARHLEAASRAQQTEATLLVDSDDAGFIVTVTFDLEAGLHVQRSANGTGERPVRRAAGGATTVDFDGISHELQPEWASSFQRVAWVHLDPVTGVVAPYSKENAELCEKTLRQRTTAVRIDIHLPNGNTIGANVSVNAETGSHSQSTGAGVREVRRLELPKHGSAAEVAVYRLPADDSIDSERYRFSRTENHTHTQSIPIALGCFMEEEALPLATFASLADLERGLQQMRYPQEHMVGLARRLKNGPFVDACRLLSAAYTTSEVTSFKPLSVHLDAITKKWADDGYLASPETEAEHMRPPVQPTDGLLDDLQGAKDRDFLIKQANSRAFGSNGLKVAAAAAYLLINPDVTSDEEAPFVPVNNEELD